MLLNKFISIGGLCLCVMYLINCTNNTNLLPELEASSFDYIQDQILTPNCATSGCHDGENSSSFRQHKLVLTRGNSYNNLLNIKPQNANAIINNFLLVNPYNPDKSLLYHKIVWAENHHNSVNYGSQMPLGGEALFQGQIEFIRQWIAGGASEKGDIANKNLLVDKTPSISQDSGFAPLIRPLNGTGFQLKVDKMDLLPNFEREVFIRRIVGNNTDIYVNRIQLKSRMNIHHMVIYGFRDNNNLPTLDQLRDLRLPNGMLNLNTLASMSNHIFMGGGTDGQQDYTLPEGMAIHFPAGISVDLNPHYFNRTNQVHYGENYVNLYTLDKAKVKTIVNMLDLTNTNIPIEPGQRTTHIRAFLFNKPRNIVSLTSHTHQLGEKFIIKIKGGKRNGEVIYESTDWEHPPVINFQEPIQLLSGEGLESVITYYNPTNRHVQFGLSSNDEMGIIFGYYYEP